MSILRLLAIVAVLSSQAFSSKICKTNENCVPDSNCINGLCICSSAKVFSADGKKCLDVSLGLGSPCIESSQCAGVISGATICTIEGLCACEDGYKYSHNSCVLAKNLNEDCSGVQCFDGVDLYALQCKEGKCICNEGYYLRNGTDCRPSAGSTNECLLNIECKSYEYCNFEFGPYGKCAEYERDNSITDNIYLTKNELIYSKTDNKYLDLPCKKDEECTVSNSYCALYRQKCACKVSFVYDKNTQQCVTGLGEECSDKENTKCLIRNSFCNKNNKCQCNKYYIYGKYSEKCFKPARELGNSCGRDQNCYSFGIYAVCKNNKCECGYGFDYDPVNMLCRSLSGSSTDPCKKCQLISHSTCVDNKCVCLEDYLTEDDKCLPDLGAQCNEQRDDCLIANAKCDKYKDCMCADGFVKDTKRQCIEGLDAVNATCKNDVQCKQFYGAGAACLKEKCKCLPEYTLKTVNNETSCWFIKTFGDSCTIKTECETMLDSDHVVCRNGKCACEYGFVIKEENDQLKCSNFSPIIIAQSLLFLMFVSTVIRLV